MHKKSIFSVIISKVAGLVLFILMVWLANYLVPFINSVMYVKIVHFVNNNFSYMIAMSVIFGVGEIFFALPFPVNLPAPLFSSIASLFLVAFIGRILGFAQSIANVDITDAFTIFSFIIYPVVFFAVFIGGYITIFAEVFGHDHREKRQLKKSSSRGERTWGDIGDEFKNVVFDFFAMLRRAVNGK
jgi:hypothetical protein